MTKPVPPHQQFDAGRAPRPMCREVTLLARLLERMPCRRPMRAARALALLIAFFVLLAGAGRAWAACPAGQAPTGPNGACLCANGTPPLQGACINLVCQAGQPMTASGICCAPGTMPTSNNVCEPSPPQPTAQNCGLFEKPGPNGSCVCLARSRACTGT